MFRKILFFFGVLPFKEVLENGILHVREIKVVWRGRELFKTLAEFFSVSSWNKASEMT